MPIGHGKQLSVQASLVQLLFKIELYLANTHTHTHTHTHTFNSIKKEKNLSNKKKKKDNFLLYCHIDKATS